MMTADAFPFTHLTVAQADRLLDVLRAGMSPAGLVNIAAHLGFMPSAVRDFIKRNPEAVARARARRPA